MRIGKREIGQDHPPYLIAEAGLCHNGSLVRAVQMVTAAKEAGCDAVKFQTYRTEEFCQPNDPMFPIFKTSELPAKTWGILKQACDQVGIDFLSTPQNVDDLELLLPWIKAIKVGSDDSQNFPLLREYAKHGLPMIVSMGMCAEDDVSRLCEFMDDELKVEWVPMVCTSQYPTPQSEVNALRLVGFGTVGFSDHTIGNTASIMATALGACIIERHFTIDKALPGPDHAWACNPPELALWVGDVREACEMRGSCSFELSERELEQKRKYQRRAGERLRGAA